ncbi:tautomerase family protein [Acanthopleuribacter pedis]|uniref:Tautomerase family protein n=1 Tax=Acanthopleuribacter pedis TaxID=442870 RepID=A0A8J7QP65_9BACT|nr:tautomerase family protein [Acanthopleuribacter pedis]MBO1321565.1 tautomerase family protein [Acanthopleuribacter pedis]
MIVIYGVKEALNPRKAKMSDLLHQCMQQVLGMPEDKRAHRFIPMDSDDFYAPGGRSAAYTVIEINMMAGRSPETIKALIKAIFRAFEDGLGLAPVDVEITVNEQPAHCWGFRGITGDEARLNYRIDV